jgi:uncharacterized protein
MEGLRSGGSAVVALSGGVDSAVVAHLARGALGTGAYAVTITGPAVGTDEVDRARAAARSVGIDHSLVAVDPLTVREYQENPSNRCYFCRRTEAGAIRLWADGRGIARFLDGVHLDDLGDDRPGLVALREAGFRHPLVEAGWRKPDVREYARSVGLPNWDQPSDACLASRVRHGHPISLDLLRRVERAEQAVRARGFRQVRVRTDGRSARVEVDAASVGRLRSPATASAVVGDLREMGFDPVTLDPDGYRTRPGA